MKERSKNRPSHLSHGGRRPRRDEKATPQKIFEEEKTSDDFIFGKHSVLSHLESGKQVNKLFIQKAITGPQIESILQLAKERGIVYQEVPKSKLDELSQEGTHQGVVLSLPAFDYADLDNIFDLAGERDQDPFVLVLDGIEDPHNLGSILRTADAVGVHGVIIPKRRSVGLTGIVAKTSTGAIDHVPVVRVTNLAQTLQTLKDRGLWIFATDMAGEDMRQWNSQGPIALVIGNEGQGVSELVKKSADGIVTIPMVGHVQSLNASVAAAVLMYEVARQRI